MAVDVVCELLPLECEATTKSKEYLTLAVNVANMAVSQLSNYNFNSLVSFGGKSLAAGHDGIFLLDDGQLDGEAEIDSFFEFWVGDADVLNVKRIRAVHVGGEFGGDMELTVTDDDGLSQTYPVVVSKTANEQHGVRVFVSRAHKGRYWKLRVANTDGADWSVDRVDVTWNVLGSKQSGS